jgi:hypothetical protein
VHWGGAVLIGVLCFLLGVGCGSVSANTRPSAAPAATSSAPTSTPPTYRPPAITVAPAPAVVAAPAGTITNGTYEVGTEVAPGKYKSPGPESGAISLCYVDVQQGDKYLLQELSNDGQVRIEIKANMAGALMEVSGCQPFAKVG